MNRVLVAASGLLRRLVLLAIFLFAIGGPAWLFFRDRVPHLSNTKPLPEMCFKAETWYAYLRKHSEIPMHFYCIRPDSKGAVYVRGAEYTELEEVTGGLPEQQVTAYVDKQGVFWVFDFQKNEYVRPETEN